MENLAKIEVIKKRFYTSLEKNDLADVKALD
jgi:hypothetical protein